MEEGTAGREQTKLQCDKEKARTRCGVRALKVDQLCNGPVNAD
jgi:hypothetical protein